MQQWNQKYPADNRRLGAYSQYHLVLAVSRFHYLHFIEASSRLRNGISSWHEGIKELRSQSGYCSLKNK